MIIPGRSLIPKIVTNVRSATIQAQPCGVDLTLKCIRTWDSPGSVDFDNSLRSNASTTELPFLSHQKQSKRLSPELYPIDSKNPALLNEPESIMLKRGAYLVEFNETVNVPLDLMGQIFVRSSLFRSGALLSAGVMDSGYEGAVGAMMQVMNPLGLLLFRDARLGQMVFHQMSEPVEGYSGQYQGSKTV